MSHRKKTAAPLKRGFIHDPVEASLLNSLKITHSCEHCSYFNPEKEVCMLGHNTKPHRYKRQMFDYSMSGKMALCRNLEID